LPRHSHVFQHDKYFIDWYCRALGVVF